MEKEGAIRLCDRGLELIKEEREHLWKIKRRCSQRMKRLKLEEAKFKHYKRVIRKRERQGR